MSNPFLETSGRFLSDSVVRQMRDLEPGDSMVVNPPSDAVTIKRLRAMIFYSASKLGFQVKTKSDFLGDLWVMRIG